MSIECHIPAKNIIHCRIKCSVSIKFKGQPIIFMHVFNDGCCRYFKYNVHINVFFFLVFFFTTGLTYRSWYVTF